MSTSIDRLVDELPSSNMTTRALGALDFIAPGQWQNVTGFDNMIRHVTGEQDAGIIQSVRDRALQLYGDSSQGYQRAIQLYQLVDSADSKVGWAAAAHKLGEKVGLLSFLSKLTPKEDTAQTFDLALKIALECSAFCYANGFPGDSISDFLAALKAYEKENLIRMAGIVTFDGLIPLGPDYAGRLSETIANFNPSDIEDNAIFQRVKGLLPGGAAFVGNAVSAASGYVGEFAGRYGVTLDSVLGRLNGFVDFSESRLDYLAAFLDVSTNYMEHTGIQSVSRSLIERAVGEI